MMMMMMMMIPNKRLSFPSTTGKNNPTVVLTGELILVIVIVIMINIVIVIVIVLVPFDKDHIIDGIVL